MAQSPLLVDAVQIEPGASGTRLIERDTATGGLAFSDAEITTAVLLSQLVGFRAITGVFVVGRAGSGAQYTAIQDALDAVPDSSSAAAPSLVLITAGVYTENVVIQKDGVVLHGLGGAKISNSGDDETVTVSASLDTTPLSVVLRGLEIENDQDGRSCVRILGADTFASGTVTCNTAPLAAGDTLTINGNVLTGIAGTRNSGSNNFSVLGSTTTAIAAEIAAAINDTANSFSGDVSASVASNIITLQAVTAGSGGNAITLADSTTPSGGFSLSGATLSGGSSDGSVVVSQGLLVESCTLVSSGNSGYQINADTANHILVRQGTWRGSASTSSCRAADCASLRVFGVEWANDFALSFDTGNDNPSETPTTYEVQTCGRVGDIVATLTSAGALDLRENPVVGNLTVGGTQAVSAVSCGFGDLDFSDTVVATLSRCARGSAVSSSGSPTLDESRILGSVSFTSSTQESVVFDVENSDADYTVVLESPSTVAFGVSSKAATGFDIDAASAITGTVSYVVQRDT